MARTGAADLTLYEGFFNYFPLQFRSDASPVDRLYLDAAEGSSASAVDVVGYEQATGIEIDFVVIWGWEEVADDASLVDLNPLRSALATGYRVVLETQRGNVTVFQRI